MPDFAEGYSITAIGIVASMVAGAATGLGGVLTFVLRPISDEIIPETPRRGHERVATYAVIVGFVLMMVLDTLFA